MTHQTTHTITKAPSVDGLDVRLYLDGLTYSLGRWPSAVARRWTEAFAALAPVGEQLTINYSREQQPRSILDFDTRCGASLSPPRACDLRLVDAQPEQSAAFGNPCAEIALPESRALTLGVDMAEPSTVTIGTLTRWAWVGDGFVTVQDGKPYDFALAQKSFGDPNDSTTVTQKVHALMKRFSAGVVTRVDAEAELSRLLKLNASAVVAVPPRGFLPAIPPGQTRSAVSQWVPVIDPQTVRKLASEIGCAPTTDNAHAIERQAWTHGILLSERCSCGAHPNPSESLTVDADGALRYVCDDCYDASTGEPPIAAETVKSALSHINRYRARHAQRELDPVASEWLDKDVLVEARRLGWAP